MDVEQLRVVRRYREGVGNMGLEKGVEAAAT
jgi:hypothetical protein